MTPEEAINIVRNICQTDKEKEALATLIPELAESEDERIRRAINLILIATEEYQDAFYRTHNLTRKECTAWLEKQKEQKSELPLMNGDADLYFDEWRQQYQGSPTKRECFEEGIEYAQRVQKEQKPALYWHKIKANDYLPCRAYLWKLAYEEENNFMGKCHVDGYLVPNEPVGVGCDTWYLPVEDIKNLPKEEGLDTVSPMKTVEQKPASGNSEKPNNHAEWSEEDEKMRLECIDVISHFPVPGTTIGPFYECIYWLQSLPERFKSLRPQPHWKPSEYTLSLVKKVADGEMLTGMEQMAMETLCDDLQKRL